MISNQARPLLTVDNLTVSFSKPTGRVSILNNLTLSVQRRETLCLVGESGAGKSLTATSIIRLLPPTAQVESGEVRFNGRDLLQTPEREMNSLRGNEISMVFQQPVTSLHPTMPIGKQVAEMWQIHADLPRKVRKEKALHMLRQLQFEDPERIAQQYAWQLSGGQAQRIMLAMALACQPKLLIADEPTTALDTSTQAEILSLLTDLKQEYELTILLITHDMAVVKQMADRVAVMHQGEIVEVDAPQRIFEQAGQPYTRQLVRAAQVTPLMQTQASHVEVALTAERIVKRYHVKQGLFRSAQIDAVKGVSLDIRSGETLALVGQSGSGKTTLAHALSCFKLPESGSVIFRDVDLLALKPRERYPYLKQIQMVFQDPRSAFNPYLPVARSIIEGLVIHKIGTKSERQDRLARVLVEVGLTEEQAERSPAELSGGQLQRAAIARAVIMEPTIIVLDEPVSALDVIARANILKLLKQLQMWHGMSLLLITHNMLIVREMAHRVAVMHQGEIVEVGTNEQIFNNPVHPQTRALLDAVPGDWLASDLAGAVE